MSLLPLFWRRSLGDLKTHQPGKQVPLDTAMNSLGERSLKTVVPAHQIATATAAGNLLPAVPGVYYIIRGWLLTGYNAAAGTSTGTTMTFTKFPENVSTVFAAMALVPSVACVNQATVNNLALVTQPNTAVALADLTAAPTGETAILYYDEVRQVD